MNLTIGIIILASLIIPFIIGFLLPPISSSNGITKNDIERFKRESEKQLKLLEEIDSILKRM